MSKLPCEAVIHKGAIAFACGKESEYFCEAGVDGFVTVDLPAFGPRCLEHSHLGGCCQRMFWPEDWLSQVFQDSGGAQ